MDLYTRLSNDPQQSTYLTMISNSINEHFDKNLKTLEALRCFQSKDAKPLKEHVAEASPTLYAGQLSALDHNGHLADRLVFNAISSLYDARSKKEKPPRRVRPAGRSQLSKPGNDQVTQTDPTGSNNSERTAPTKSRRGTTRTFRRPAETRLLAPQPKQEQFSQADPTTPDNTYLIAHTEQDAAPHIDASSNSSLWRDNAEFYKMRDIVIEHCNRSIPDLQTLNDQRMLRGQSDVDHIRDAIRRDSSSSYAPKLSSHNVSEVESIRLVSSALFKLQSDEKLEDRVRAGTSDDTVEFNRYLAQDPLSNYNTPMHDWHNHIQHSNQQHHHVPGLPPQTNELGYTGNINQDYDDHTYNTNFEPLQGRWGAPTQAYYGQPTDIHENQSGYGRATDPALSDSRFSPFQHRHAQHPFLDRSMAQAGPSFQGTQEDSFAFSNSAIQYGNIGSENYPSNPWGHEGTSGVYRSHQEPTGQASSQQGVTGRPVLPSFSELQKTADSYNGEAHDW